MPREPESEIGTLEAIAPAAHPRESKYERLVARAKQVAAAQTIVVHNWGRELREKMGRRK